MKCVICNQSLDMFNVDLGNGIKAHLTCFYDKSIPDAPTKTNSNFHELNEIRKDAINARIKEIRNSIN